MTRKPVRIINLIGKTGLEIAPHSKIKNWSCFYYVSEDVRKQIIPFPDKCIDHIIWALEYYKLHLPKITEEIKTKKKRKPTSRGGLH
jgi:hypothetical protein